MKISELKAKMGGVNIEAAVDDVEEPKTMNKYGRELRLANATISDDSGSIQLSLWNDQIDQVKKGGKIKIENGYVNEWQGKIQLTLGKFGKMEVL
ncbi:MAG: OB-fold nucleic acid binding domain-containing protein [Candidatus Micrarchaeota archaeon]|nr:OB-fold nucleic acid binding domain-containing protein [Candidatus Micrarchaeota archaeon]